MDPCTSETHVARESLASSNITCSETILMHGADYEAKTCCSATTNFPPPVVRLSMLSHDRSNTISTTVVLCWLACITARPNRQRTHSQLDNPSCKMSQYHHRQTCSVYYCVQRFDICTGLTNRSGVPKATSLLCLPLVCRRSVVLLHYGHQVGTTVIGAIGKTHNPPISTCGGGGTQAMHALSELVRQNKFQFFN